MAVSAEWGCGYVANSNEEGWACVLIHVTCDTLYLQ
jgi:hypothetical protein